MTTLMEKLILGMGKGAKPCILAALIERPNRPLSTRQLTRLVPYSISTVKRAADDLVLARFVEAMRDQPRRYWIADDKAAQWRAKVRC
jgi:DNA-binding IclR family transcriptional regulator